MAQTIGEWAKRVLEKHQTWEVTVWQNLIRVTCDDNVDSREEMQKERDEFDIIPDNGTAIIPSSHEDLNKNKSRIISFIMKPKGVIRNSKRYLFKKKKRDLVVWGSFIFLIIIILYRHYIY